MSSKEVLSALNNNAANNISQTQNNFQAFQMMISKHGLEIEKALPRHMTAQQFGRIALTELRKNPQLASCDPVTFFGAVIQCAQWGLELGRDLIYLVPFKRDVQVILGYKGLIDLAYRSGQLKSISADPVYEKDDFDVTLGTSRGIFHKPAKVSADLRGGITAFYAVAELVSGGVVFEIMYINDIENVMRTSSSWKSAERGRKNSIWHLHFSEMGKKTVIRRLMKYLPKSSEILKAALNRDESVFERKDSGLDISTNSFDGEIIEEKVVPVENPS